jgi:hypothetical protein
VQEEGPPRHRTLHWVHGNHYSADAYGGFHGESGRHALAAYLDVMLSGLRAGEEWLASPNHLLLVQFGSVKRSTAFLSCAARLTVLRRT